MPKVIISTNYQSLRGVEVVGLNLTGVKDFFSFSVWAHFFARAIAHKVFIFGISIIALQLTTFKLLYICLIVLSGQTLLVTPSFTWGCLENDEPRERESVFFFKIYEARQYLWVGQSRARFQCHPRAEYLIAHARKTRAVKSSKSKWRMPTS